MKKGLSVFVNLALLIAFGVPAFSQPNSRSVESFLIDNFDSPEAQNYAYEGEELSWSWQVNSSRFIAEGYPKMEYVTGIPNSLKPFQRADVEPKVLGINTAFNRKGDNWVELIPSKDGKPYEIPFIGHVDHLDFWVWGANYLYYLDIMIRDADGRVHVLSAGNLRYNGWKNIIVKIPGWISQKSRLRSGPKTLSFVGFRIRSDAAEYVDDFTIYFDNIKYMSNSLSFIFDGYELQSHSFEGSDSGSSSSSSSASEAK